MYILEESSLQPYPQEYSYARRAQSVTYLNKWVQIAICEEVQPLVDFAKDNPPQPGGRYRIEGTAAHPGMKPILL